MSAPARAIPALYKRQATTQHLRDHFHRRFFATQLGDQASGDPLTLHHQLPLITFAYTDPRVLLSSTLFDTPYLLSFGWLDSSLVLKMASLRDDPSVITDDQPSVVRPPPADVDVPRMAGLARSPQNSSPNVITSASASPTLSSVSTVSTPTTTSTTPTSTSTSATTTPTTTSTSSTPTTTSTPTSTTTTDPITSSSTSSVAPTTSSAPLTTSSAYSSIPVVTVTYTSTGSNGNLITGLSTSAPTATSARTNSGGGSSTNLGAIIGGVAGGLAFIIILVWLILLPLRKRAKKAKEVEWLSFGQENDHVNENSAEAVYGRGAGGSGEGKGGSVANVNEIQMDNIPHEMAQQPYHYQNVDNGAAWAAAGAAGAGAYGAHEYAQHQQGYDEYYAQHGYPDQYGQYGMQAGQQWAGHPGATYPQGEAWGAAPDYTSPVQSQTHGGPGLSHSLSVGSTQVGAPGSQVGDKVGSQEGHSQYGYQSPPLGAQSPQQYPQHYQGSSPPQQPQYFQGQQQQQYGYEHEHQAPPQDQRQASPDAAARANAAGLHLANP